MSFVVVDNPEKEMLTPDPDGVTTSFHTSKPYKPGSVSVWLNGIKILSEFEDGFTEAGGTEILMKEAPWVGDSLQAEFEAL
jgi:hypothetical protein